MWSNLFDFHAGLDDLIDRTDREGRDRAAMQGYYDDLNDRNQGSWSVDNPSTRVFTLIVDDVEIEIRYTRDQYWNRDSEYYNTWDEYYIEMLPKALSDALTLFVAESAIFVNRTLGYGMTSKGPCRVKPRGPDKEDVKWINDGQRSNLEQRMGISKNGRRGGQRRLDWPHERKIAFLQVYDTMKSGVRDASDRVRLKDSFAVRMSVLNASNGALPEAQRLPASTLHKLARRADQISVDRRSAASLGSLAMEAAAEKFGIEVTEYLPKVLTSARKIRKTRQSGDISGSRKHTVAASSK